MATNLFIDIADKLAVNSLTDANPMRPPDLSAQASYPFNLYFLDYANPFTYHRYSSAQITLNVRLDGPPDSGSITLGFGSDTTPAIDINSVQDVLNYQFGLLRSVGVGNAVITGNKKNGWTVEFIGSRAGKAQQLINASAFNSSPPSFVSVVRTQLPIGGANEKQLVRVLQSPAASIGTFSEIGVPATPGWATTGSGLSTANLLPSFWLNPPYDIILETLLYFSATRSGSDGTTTQTTPRSGSDGTTYNDGRTRNGTDGTTFANSRTGSGSDYVQRTPAQSYNDIIFSNASPSPWTAADVGSTITDTGGFIPAGTTIKTFNAPGTTGVSSIHLSQKTTVPAGTGNQNITWQIASPNYKFSSAGGGGTPFSNADVGDAMSGTGIATGSTIASIVNGTTVMLSLPTTSIVSGTGTWALTGQVTSQFHSPTASFTTSDVGSPLNGPNFQSGTVIQSWISATDVTLSLLPLAAISGTVAWSIPAVISNVYQSPTANFTTADVNQNFISPNVPSGTTISNFIDSSHVTLSQTPTSVVSGIGSWTIQYVGSGSAGAPVVTSVQAGSSTQPAIQKITFSRRLLYGTFTLQDGGGGSNPLATVTAPLTAAAVQAALNTTYPAYGNVQVLQIAPTIVQITWGVNAAQTNLLVSDTNVTYDAQVLRMVLVPALVSTPVPIAGGPSAQIGTIFIQGDLSQPVPITQPRITVLNDGTKSFVVTQRFMQLVTNYSKAALNSPGPYGTVLVEESNPEDRHGVYFWDRKWAAVPANRVETHQQQRPCIGVARTYQGALLVDIQLFSMSISTWVNIYFTYGIGIASLGIPPDGPAGTVLHFQGGGLGITQLITLNGFDSTYGTFNKQFTQSWSRRRWMGDIWEQAVYVN